MAFLEIDGDVDPDLLVEIPCEFCNDLFPLILLVEHQTGCRPDLVRVVQPTIEEIEQAFLLQEAIPDVKTEKIQNSDILHQNLIQLAAEPLIPKRVDVQKENTSENKTGNVKKNRQQDFDVNEVIKDELLQENETNFTFGSSPNRGKGVKEEKPNYKISNIPILKDSEIKHPINNIIPDSDNEEGESLEDFWKKADVILSQRLRELEKRRMYRKN